ncbi:MAG: YigZ family protein [Clostridia bacterium]|nr:YigZ family protein [Clostridia bacterium]
MSENKTRKTVSRSAEAKIEEKRSEFIANVAPVSSEDEARAFIESVKKKYYDAKHNVFAYVLAGGNVSRFTDDGEPKGSAGIPVLGVINKYALDGVCIVVTRYFGGILLGTGGLVRAYSAAAKEAIDAAGVSDMVEYDVLEFTCSYSDYTKISPKLESLGCKEEEAQFEADVRVRVSCLPSDAAALAEFLSQTTSGKSVPAQLYSEERVRRQ